MVGMLRSIENWGFDQRNYAGQFAIDIVNLVIAKEGCLSIVTRQLKTQSLGVDLSWRRAR